jgi:DNA-binding NarL/FixJ family response regulator
VSTRPPAWKRRLLVVEDETLLASLLCQVLESAGFQAIAAGSAATARDLIDDFDPDGALIDINLGQGPNGLHLGHLLRRTHPHMGLIFLTKYIDPRVSDPKGWTVPEGSAFLSKDRIADTDFLMNAIESVLTDSKATIRHDQTDVGKLNRLTQTQLEILQLTALGMTNAAIARMRNTNERAVEKRLKSVYEALEIHINADINPRVEAVRIYFAEAGHPGSLDGSQ